jgi:DNA-binding response OmpR family regulator
VESTPGRGSSFYFEFPLKEVLGAGPLEEDVRESDWMASRTLPQAEPLASPAETPADAPLLFLVEDNDSMRDYISSLLQSKYQVVQAENGRMALDLLSDYAANLPQLIISDIMMPVMDGFQLLGNLKNDERWRHIPVVMLTARADMDDKLRALRIGVDDYLSKPFEEDELLARVENLIRQFQGRAVLPEDEDPAEQPLAPTFSAADLRWLEAFEQLVEKELGNFNLTAEMLAEKMLMSRSPFFRQLKRLTGLTPAQYLDEARFQKARRMFERREASSVKSVAYAVGFKQVKHFSQNYKKRFGKLPSEYAA